LNAVVDRMIFNSVGRRFQKKGAATEKARVWNGASSSSSSTKLDSIFECFVSGCASVSQLTLWTL